MLRRLLLTPPLILCTGLLVAQTATVTGGLVDINFSNVDGTPNSTTYTFGAATGGTAVSTTQTTPTQLGVVNTNGGLSFDNFAVVAEQLGGCTVTGGEAVVTGQSGNFLGGLAFPPQTLTIPLTLVGPCSPTPPATLPSGLPCGANQVLLSVDPNQNTSFPDLTPAGAIAALINPINASVSIRLTASPGCNTTDAQGFTQFSVQPGNAPVPVELVSFSARRAGGQDLVEWTAAGEVDLAGYEVQRSRDGETFEAVAFVEALGTGTGHRAYRSAQALGATAEASTATRYYRLRAVDFDGSSQLSAVVAVAASGAVRRRAPIAQQTLLRQGSGTTVNELPIGASEVFVLDAAGQVAARVRAEVGSRIGSELPAGVYLLSASGTDAVWTQRLVVQ